MRRRRYFYTLAEREILRAVRFNSPCSVVLIDIDFFKRINDTYGHQTGDRALVIFAKTCQENVRKVDILARLGGEEFGILLPETYLEQARETAERIREIIDNTTIDVGNSNFKLSASFGVSVYESEQDALDTLLRKADRALYHPKNTGRNRVSIWNERLDRDWMYGH
jgi:diguanylate cyclase (GGDEF)-like protein